MLNHKEIISEIEPLDKGKAEPLKDRAQPRSYRRRPLKAWRHFRKLIANKEDTEQVFHTIQALNGKTVYKGDLPAILDDHARWKALPKGSVGRAYVDFMEREGLSAQGLVDEYNGFANKIDNNLDPDISWYINRRRDTHDLCHVLTDYGRDAMGEACVLSFSHGQNRSLGVIFIAVLASLEIRKNAPKGAPIFRACRLIRATP